MNISTEVTSAVIFGVLIAILISNISLLIGPEEFCPRETFVGECKNGEVIEMRSARYGLMHIGKCAPEDDGNTN